MEDVIDYMFKYNTRGLETGKMTISGSLFVFDITVPFFFF